MTPVLEDQLSKIWSFPIKTKVSQALGMYDNNIDLHSGVFRFQCQVDLPVSCFGSGSDFFHFATIPTSPDPD